MEERERERVIEKSSYVVMPDGKSFYLSVYL